jgi:hypothetical protein
MFYHLLKKHFQLPFLLLVGFGIFLYAVDTITALCISEVSGVKFRYVESAHLKLIYILLAVVVIALTSAVNQNERADPKLIRKNFLKWILFMVIPFLLGDLIHINVMSNALMNNESIMDLERNIWLYSIADYFLIIGFSIGGFIFIRPLIHGRG